VSETNIGTASSKAIVQGDFVLSPNAPLAVAPGDEFEVSVGVANNVAGSGKDAQVAVTLKASPHLELIGSDTQSLKIGEMKEGVAIYKLKARAGTTVKLGSATMMFAATLNGQPEVGQTGHRCQRASAGPYHHGVGGQFHQLAGGAGQARRVRRIPQGRGRRLAAAAGDRQRPDGVPG
jgi:uncharacterized protein YfaS (alpha-2-macroglobulin family)